MESLGEYLRRERERRGVGLEEVARVTRVRRQHLEALEQDRHDLLPAPPFVRGFLSAYAKHLGLAADDVLARYQTGGARGTGPRTAGAGARHDAERASPSPAPSLGQARPRQAAGAALGPAHRGILTLLGLVALVALAVVGSMMARPAAPPRPAPEEAVAPDVAPGLHGQPAGGAWPAGGDAPPAYPALAEPDAVAGPEEVVPEAPVPTVAAAADLSPPGVPAREAQTAPAGGAPAPAIGVDGTADAAPAASPAAVAAATPERLSILTAIAVEETWIQVTIDADRQAEVLLKPGERVSWQGGRFDLVVGNAGGVTLELDGVAEPPLGESGRRITLTLPRSSAQ